MEEPRWCVPGCPGHLGKFEDCVTEALYGITMDGGHDGETGSTDWNVWCAYLGWFSAGHPPYEVDAGWIGIPVGSYLVYTNDRGFVWSRHYPTEAAALAEFDRVEAAYGLWDDDDGHDEGLEHADYPHVPGYLHDCPACELRCHCTPGSAQCVYGGEHG